MRFLKKLLPGFYIALVFAFLYLPIAVLILFSFNNIPKSYIWGGFTLRNYTNLFSGSDGGQLFQALLTTLKVAAIASVVSTVIAVFSCLGMSYLSKRLQGILFNLTYVPNVMPELVTGISFMLLFSFLGVQKGEFTLILAHIAFCVPFAVLSINPKLKQLDKNLSEAAMDLGATQWQTLRLVIIPEIMPGIISGALIAFSMSFDDFVISLFTTGPGVNNISIYVYANVKRVNPTINALSAIIVYVITIVLILVNVVPLIRERKMKKNEN